MPDVLERLTAAVEGRYRIERELGAGGMATVWLAEDLRHHRRVAIKLLREDLAASLGSARFLREIAIAAELQHPHILPLLDSGDAGGFLFYVMPYVAGHSLRERLAREGELPIPEAVRLITEVVDALAHAHEHGVVHRDVKPDNVMLSGRHALVTDFGVAKAVSEASGRSEVTTAGVALGTPAYMSPEQAAADPHVDQRSDIYAVGVMAYEVLAGRPPFTGATPQQVLAAHLTQAPDPLSRHRPGVSPALEAVVMRCLAKRPADRWQTAGELLAALEPLGTPSGGVTPTQTRPLAAVGGGRAGTAGGRRTRWLAGGAALLALAAAGGWGLVTARGRDAAARTVAVLPFDNVARDTALDYVADGLANDVRSGLMTLPGVSVKARTSSEAAKGRAIRDAGRLLDVGLVLQGALRRAAGRTSVTVDLVNVADESGLWTGTYVLPADGNFSAAQDSITTGVARALKLQAPAALAPAVARRGTSDQEAYDLYLRGQYLFARRGGENLTRAVTAFQDAIARDSTFARAWAGLAMVYSILPGYVQAHGDSSAREGERVARHALALDSTLVDGHLALANALSVQGRPREAEPEFLATLALDPRNATAHQWHGGNLMVLARTDEAARELRAAVELDPLSAVAASDLAGALVAGGRFDEAVAAAHRTLELDATMPFAYQMLGLAFAFTARPDSAAQAFEHFFRADSAGPSARAYRVWRYALAGRWAEAGRERAEVARSRAGARDFDLAVASLALGDRETALAALERAARQRAFYVTAIALGCDPTFGPLKPEPRFRAVLARLGQGLCPDTPPWPLPPRPAGG
ncbi:MAG TPA: protein kinase [Gemmatimonadales bacterium]|nr:protein kinase [Gemmatimonadales bacterium]